MIPRRDGQTLRLEMNAAMDSSPDAIGLISWNEYSENSEVEPSRANGTDGPQGHRIGRARQAPAIADFDSSAPSGFHAGPSQFVILGALVVLVVGSVGVIVLRRTRSGEGKRGS